MRPHRPPALAGLPADLLVIDAEGYTKPDALPPGRVLVVGSAQTGVQLAEELHEAGRDVVMACGRAPWAPRRLEGRDLVAWLLDTPFFEQTLAELPSPLARLTGNVQTTGHGGGHDLHYRVLQRMGVTLAGRLAGADAGHAYFAPDLAESVAFGDARYADMCELLRQSCLERGVRTPELPRPEPFVAEPPHSVRLDDFGAVIVTAGFRPDYARWVDVPDGFDEWGFPIQVDGASTVAPGLFFVGVHFLRKRRSSFLYGVGDDATVVAAQVAARSGVAAQ